MSGAAASSVGSVSLGRHDDIVMVAQLHAQLGPLLEVPLGSDGAADPLLLAQRPELLEGPGALDGRLVDTPASEDLVLALLEREVALGLPRLVGSEVGVGLDDVVLDQRVAGPPVDSKVARPSGVVFARVRDDAFVPSVISKGSA